MTTTSGENPIGKCPYCDMMHTGICWKVAAIEYHPDGSTKRVEFHGPPQLGGAVETKPLPGVTSTHAAYDPAVETTPTVKQIVAQMTAENIRNAGAMIGPLAINALVPPPSG